MRNFKLLFIFYFGIINLLQTCESIKCDREPDTTEGRLKKSLFCNYDKSLRPRNSKSNSTLLAVRMVVKHFDYISSKQTLDVSVWFSMSWSDNKLKWNPNDYDKIDTITESSSTLWLPDLSLYNSYIEKGNSPCETANCMITSAGRIMCIPPCTFSALCKAQFTRWPFDRQNCTLKLGSWVSAGSEIDFEVNRTLLTTKNHFQHANWRLISAISRKDPGIYDFLPNETYPSVSFNFIIERHSALDVALILVPALIMVTLNIVALLLRFIAMDRVFLIVVNIFVHFSFIQQISWYVPKNGNDCPNVIFFFRDSLVISTFLLVESILLRKLCLFKTPPAIWLETLTHKIITSPVVGGFFVLSMDDQKPSDAETGDSDDVKLVEGSGQIDGNTQKWMQVSKIIDCLTLIIVVLVYIIMIITLIPESYESTANLPAIAVASNTTQSD